jgi:hypothetical protein
MVPRRTDLRPYPGARRRRTIDQVEHAVEASVHLAERLGHVRAALTRDVGLLVASGAVADATGRDRFESSLAVEVGSGTHVQQAIVGEVGPMTTRDDAVVVAVQWQPASHVHLLPAFAGEFELTADPPGTRVVLRGAYTVPLGPAGRVVDWAAGRRLAHRVLAKHLESVAERIDKKARHVAASRQEPAGPGSDYFLG